MRIAIDGCDGTGKSSVVEKLANKFNCNICRLTYKGDRSLNAYINFLNCENVVHDRTFLSEIIYPKYFGRTCKLEDALCDALYRFTKNVNVNTFILTASDETLRERVSKRGDEFICDLNILKNINADYLQFAEDLGYTIIDTTNKTIDEIVEEIGGYLK